MKKLLLVLFAALVFPSFSVLGDELGKIYSLQGVVEIQRGGVWSNAAVGTILQNHDTVRTGTDSRAALLMSDGIMVRLNQFSKFQLNDKSGEKALVVAEGEAHFLSRKPKEFPTIKTPLVTASVRGTEFTVVSGSGQSKVRLIQGAVDCKNDKGELSLVKGEEAIVEPGKAPAKRLIVNPLNAVQWALYYPPVVDQDETNSLKSRSLAEKASFYLSRGQTDKAKGIHQEIEKSIKGASGDEAEKLSALINAQKIIIAITQNDKEGGQAIVNTVKPTTPSLALALSYFEQSKFDLKKAKEYAEIGLSLDPANKILLARNSELALSFGDSDEALIKASKAAMQDPDDSYLQTVKGFAELSRDSIPDAKAAFEKAIQNNSGSGLPFLGLGLARIREGDLEQGRILIQQAAHLEPSVAIYRSYLGKTFYELEDNHFAEQEYARAIELDPKDPTPYFYRSFEKLTTHRPIEALEDLETSISLNDNRAVYRSKLLLDEDTAVRGSSLARIYETVGFSELSRVEAIKSISQDYTNHSAHLMLSEAYDPYDDVIQAGISEFLIARLLSPVNFNLVRPSQAGTVSSNEYTALFDRDINRTSIGAASQTKIRSFSPTILTSGTSGNLGYALEYQSLYSDGFRQNDRDVDHTVYGSLQYQLTPEDTLLFDANAEFEDSGDTQFEYNPNLNDADSTQAFEDYIARIGFNHRFGPKSSLIGQLLVNNSDFEINDDNFPRAVLSQEFFGDELVNQSFFSGNGVQYIKFKSEGIRFDTQYIESNDLISNVIGGGILESTQRQREAIGIYEPINLDLDSYANNTEASRILFNYTTLHAAEWLDIQGGVSYSHLHLSGAPISVPFAEETDVDEQFSPKAGLMIYPTSSTLLRTAYFESVGTSGIRELERIEPTLLSGFNQQFFDIFPGTRSRNLGFGIDQKFETKTYLGGEFLKRDVIRNNPQTVSILNQDFDTGDILGKDILFEPFDTFQDEDIIRGYIYQVICHSVTTTAEYARVRDEEISLGSLATTDRIKLGVNHFDKSGLFTFVNGTWRRQDLNGFDEESDSLLNGDRDFWLLDAGVGYRFPNQHGQATITLTNILDKDYRYVPTGLDPTIYPGLGALFAVTYNF